MEGKKIKKLFYIPFSGGKGNSFSVFQKKLGNDIQIIELDFPGRGKKKSEPVAESFDSLVDNLLIDVNDNIVDKSDYSIIGHSMGAYLAFEMVLKMQEKGLQLPKELILSASPQFEILKKESFYQLDEITRDDVYNLILSNGWMDKKILFSRIFKNLIYNKIYNDLNLMIKYKISEKNIDSKVKMYVFWGEDDKYGIDAYKGWEERSNGETEFISFKGNHFFLFNNVDENSEVLKRIISG